MAKGKANRLSVRVVAKGRNSVVVTVNRCGKRSKNNGGETRRGGGGGPIVKPEKRGGGGGPAPKK